MPAAAGSGLSHYVAAAVSRQLERDNLADLIAAAEAEHGPITYDEIQSKRDVLRRTRERLPPAQGRS